MVTAKLMISNIKKAFCQLQKAADMSFITYFI